MTELHVVTHMTSHVIRVDEITRVMISVKIKKNKN